MITIEFYFISCHMICLNFTLDDYCDDNGDNSVIILITVCGILCTLQVGGYRYSHTNVRSYPGAGMGPGGQCNVMRHDQQRHHPGSTFPSMNLQGMYMCSFSI